MNRVLIVDDERCLRDALAALLANEGYAVTVADNGRDALAKLRTIRPDVVLTDFMMPLMDGGELVCAIRADAALRDLKVLMMSAAPLPHCAGDEDVTVLRKPFDVDVLLGELRRLAAPP
jgi:CheY-like chemotaxis protein